MSIFKRFKKNKKSDSKAKAASKTKMSTSRSLEQPEVVKARSGGASWASQILLKPVVTEKTSFLEKTGQYVFAVNIKTTKKQVKQAVQEIFGLTPRKINIIKVKGKARRRGAITGFTKSWKKALVTLPAGKTLKLSSRQEQKKKTHVS